MSSSCIGCPSLLETRADRLAFLGRDTGVPTCARFGKLLGTMKSTDEERTKLAEQYATSCGAAGEPRPEKADWRNLTFAVALPDLFPSAPVESELVRSCASCSHFISDVTVANESLWLAGICEVKGKLILGNRQTYEARDCDKRSYGSNTHRDALGGLMFLPEFKQESQPNEAQASDKAGTPSLLRHIAPGEFESDRPVSDQDKAVGIDAWRKIEDDHERKVFLPVYRRDFFSEEEQSKIPTSGDEEHPEDYVDHNGFTYKVAALWMELDETPGLWGQAGTGKTELGRHLAWLMGLPFERFSITASTELEDLAGKMLYTPEVGTYWQNGRLSNAWLKPGVIVIDEPNTGPPDVWQFLRPLIDNSKQLVLDQNAGERLSRHNDAFMMMAMNPAWDSKNVGANMISDADANRLMHISIDLPPEHVEMGILRKRCSHDGYEIPESDLATIMRIAKDIRSLCKEDALPITWAIRPQLKVARASRWFGMLEAYRMASAEFLEPSAQEALLDVVRAHVNI